MKTTIEIPDIISFTIETDVDNATVTFSIASQNPDFTKWIHDNPYQSNGLEIKSMNYPGFRGTTVFLCGTDQDRDTDTAIIDVNTPGDYAIRLSLAIKAAAKAYLETKKTKTTEIPGVITFTVGIHDHPYNTGEQVHNYSY